MNQEVNKKEVGERIKSIRLEMGYTMTEFAKIIDPNAKSGTISNWETGRNLPNKIRLSNIAFHGQMSVDELLHGKFCVWEETYIDREILEKPGCHGGYGLYIETMEDHSFTHCPYCGKELKIVKAAYKKEFTAELSINGSTEEMDIDAWDEDDAWSEAVRQLEDDDDEVVELIEHKPKRIIRRRIA